MSLENSDDDWFEKDEDELLQGLQSKQNIKERKDQPKDINITTEVIEGPKESDEYLKTQRLEMCSATTQQAAGRSGKVFKLQTLELRQIAQMEPLDTFLCVMIQDHTFFDQIKHNDSLDRILLYTQIMSTICDLELPGFHKEFLQKFASHEKLLEHFRIIASKLFTKRYETMWKDEHQVDRIVGEMQTLFVQTHKVGVQTAKMMDVIKHIRKLLKTSDSPEIAERAVCVTFRDQLDILLATATSDGEAIAQKEQTIAAQEIFPTLDELLTESDESKSYDGVEKSFDNIADYVNMQKELLREDFLIPLRHCVHTLKQTQTLNSLAQPLRLYKDVCIVLNTQFITAHRHEMLFIDVLGSRRGTVTNSKYLQNILETKLKIGALFCMTTSSEFENLILATVTYTDAEVSRAGYIGIEIMRQYNIGNIYNKSMLMFETPTFFVPYHYVYNYLSTLNITDFPMQNIIIFGETNIKAPAYINANTIYTYEDSEYKPLEEETPKALPLNLSQRSAFSSALIKEFTLIQGPPGTGKTHLSVHLMRTLIDNAKTPIVLITYTNGSLDKFLLKVSEYTRNIVRFGSQTRLPEIARFNINNESYNAEVVNPKLKRLYYIVTQEFKAKFEHLQELHKEFDGTEECYVRILRAQKAVRAVALKLNSIHIMFQFYVARKSDVIAVTTTCAAKINFLFRLLKSSVVMFEEAAEILEPHIIACLTSSTQHVIMIGDHMQLQPHTSSYQHSRSSKLNVSLFERLVTQQHMKPSVLNVQYRMRPAIAELMHPIFYAELNNAVEVESYPQVRKMRKNLFFVTHEKLEYKSKPECSIFNQFEIDEILKVAMHLIVKADYSAEDIVILSPYAQQIEMFNLKISNEHSLKDINCVTVDSFQGLEANIVLLSLVRSNLDTKIGFLNEKNRICVALSRAKHGLYIIGNMKMLSACSATWKAIEEKFVQQDAIGDEFPYEDI